MKNTQDMTRYAIYLAIITMFAQIPQLGFINFGTIQITTLPIIVVPMIMLDNKWSSTIFISITWGVNAWLTAVFRASDPVSLWFRNPLIGFLPRVLAGIIAYAVIRKILKLRNRISITNTNLWIHTITILTVSAFAFIGTIVPTNGSESLRTIFMVIFAIIGYIFASILHDKVKSDLKSGPNVIVGFLSGSTLAFIHTALVLVSWKLFLPNEADLVNSIISIVIGVNGFVELTMTAFITMSLFPSLAVMSKSSK